MPRTEFRPDVGKLLVDPLELGLRRLACTTPASIGRSVPRRGEEDARTVRDMAS